MEFRRAVAKLSFQGKCIVVLGMHRSGTSALAGALSMLGANPGPSLMPAYGTVNPRGFWEHAEIVAIHDQLLEALGFSWHDERPLPDEWWRLPEVKPYQSKLIEVLRRDFSDSLLWVIKDPRMCRIFPLWKSVIETIQCNLGIVIILRDPREVAASLLSRDGIPEDRAYLLWMQYIIEAEKWSRNYPRVIITYEELLENWRSVLNQVSTSLSLELSNKDIDAERNVDAFLESDLRHHSINRPPVGQWENLAFNTYQACIALRDSDQLGEALAPTAAEINKIVGLLDSWSREIQNLWHVRSELDEREREIKNIKNELIRVKSTISWWVTKPLRLISNLPGIIKNMFDTSNDQNKH